MTADPKLIADDIRRKNQHQDVKDVLTSEVNHAIAAEARSERAVDPDIADAGRALEQRAVREAIDTDSEIRKSRGAARGAQILDYLFFLLYGLIVIEIVLELAGARETNGFKQVMDTITYPFLRPFKGLFADPASGEYRVMFSYLAALGIYILAHIAIRGLLRLFGTRKTTI